MPEVTIYTTQTWQSREESDVHVPQFKIWLEGHVANISEIENDDGPGNDVNLVTKPVLLSDIFICQAGLEGHVANVSEIKDGNNMQDKVPK